MCSHKKQKRGDSPQKYDVCLRDYFLKVSYLSLIYYNNFVL